jgi:hypothetical protein
MAASMELSLAMAAVPWKASTKTVFLHGMIKMGAHDFLLQSLPSILSEMNSNLQILRDFTF